MKHQKLCLASYHHSETTTISCFTFPFHCSDLSFNNFSVVNDGVFTGLTGLTTLTMSNSFIQNLTGHPFEKIPRLELLILDNNLLTNKPLQEALHGSRYLHTLDLSHNMLTKVPSLRRVGYPHLTNLRLGYNNIAVIRRADLEGMSFIRELILKENQLEEIEHDAFAECPNITLLDLDGSRLSTLPNLTYLPGLRNLHLNRGRLMELPADLCQGSKHLTILEVEDNLLLELPSFAKCTPGLTVGAFGHNRIQRLQNNTFADQFILRYLDLGDNLLSVLPDSLFEDGIELEHLNLSHNGLTELSPRLFENSVSLINLDISHNSVQRLQKGLFKNNMGMDILYLNNNQISKIDDYAFPEYSELRRLDLSRNNFSSWNLPHSGFPFLTYLNLRGNPQLLNVPSRSETPRISHVEYTYPHHCCIWKDFVQPPALISNGADVRTDFPPTGVPTSSATNAPPPGWDSCPPENQRTREKLEALIDIWNFTIQLLPDCKIEIVSLAPSNDKVTVGVHSEQRSQEKEEEHLVDEYTTMNIEESFSELAKTRAGHTRSVTCLPQPVSW